eukprot:m.577036 g.577036  ORF g.577036 m.577036 type:complete len:98 (-) comp22292_c0_seq6:2165-2458(-)
MQVKKVIHTSSVAAIQTYDKPADYVFSEKDWNDWSSETNKDYYGIAKVEAEKIMKEASEAHGFELVCINPGVVFGNTYERIFHSACVFRSARKDRMW